MINKVIQFDPQLIRLLPTIIAVAESKNFKEAADKLKISQPAVTQQIKLLEESFDIPIMKIVGKKKVLTVFGQEIYLSAKQHLNQLMTSMSMTQNKFNDPTQKTLRIAARSEILEFVLPQLSFAGKLHCSLLSASDAAKKLLEGELDLAITHERPLSSELFSKIAFESRMVFAAHKSLIKRFRGPFSEDFFKSVPYLSYKNDSYVQDLIAQNFSLKREAIRQSVICEDWGVIRSLVISKQGFSIVPYYVGSTFPPEIEIIELPKKEAKTFTYHFLFRKENKAEISELLRNYPLKT